MILKHYILKCSNNIADVIKELEKINNGIEELYINSVEINKNQIRLHIDEKEIDEIVKLTSW